jgi:hypothetical protein
VRKRVLPGLSSSFPIFGGELHALLLPAETRIDEFISFKLRFVPFWGSVKMLGISGKCTILFKTDGPRMLAGAKPSSFSIRSHSRKDNHACKARKFGCSIDGVASVADSSAADSLLAARPSERRTSLERRHQLSVIENRALHVGLLTRAITATKFTGLALGGTL